MPDYFADVRSVLLFAFSIIATLAVALRFWSRRIQTLRFERNDYLIVPGLAFALGEVIMYICSTPSSLTLNAIWAIWSINDPDVQELNSQGKYEEAYAKALPLVSELYFLSQIFWAIAVTFIRSSIILLYIRIFPARSFRFTCYAVLTINAAFCIGVVFTDCLICIPFSCRWDSEGCSQCGNEILFSLFTAIFNLLLDITVVVLPMPLLGRLQMAVSKKIVLGGMFGLGTAICAVTAYRLQLSHMTINWAAVDDVADSTPKLMFLMCLEAILGVLNACLPVLKPVFSKVCCAIKNFNVKKIRSISWKTHSTSAIIQVSQMWESRSKKHSRGGELDSTISVQGLRRSEGSIQSTSMAERVVGTKVFEIHVQNDIHVSSGRPSLGSHIV